MEVIRMLLLVAIISCAGCAHVGFDPETGRVNYTRIGDQQIEGFEITKTQDGFVVVLDNQNSEAEALTEAIKLIGVLSAPAML